MLSQVYVIARHELRITFATRRAIASAALYLASSALAAVAYVQSLNAVQRHATQLLTTQGVAPEQASELVARAVEQSYAGFVTFFASTKAAVAQSLTDSMILPAFLWGSLAFLPLLVVLTSFDAISNDLQGRSLCYSTLRASRATVLLGKLLAQSILFIGLSVLASAAMIATALSLLPKFDLVATLPGLLRTWSLLLPYGFAYLGLSSFCSSSVKQPTLGLMLALGLMVGLWVFGQFRHIPLEHRFGWLQWLGFLSPARYQGGLWEAGLAGPLSSALAYAGFGAGFTALSWLQLSRRDL